MTSDATSSGWGSKGESPYFVLSDTSIVTCEVHGRVPHIRTPVPAMPMAVAMPGEEDEALPPEDDAAVPPIPAPLADDDPAGKTVRALKAEAVSVTHLMTHTPKNPYCAACRRAKVQRKPCRRKKWFKGLKPTKFGEQVTADHVIANSDRSMGVTRDKSAATWEPDTSKAPPGIKERGRDGVGADGVCWFSQD